jgi:hypothetical protein
VLIPVVIFAVCLGAGVVVSAQYLPSLADGVVGGIAFFLVCGLLGGALALIGLHIYSIVNAVEEFGGGRGRGEFVATGLTSMVWETGSLLALTAVVYLLAPRLARVSSEPALSE